MITIKKEIVTVSEKTLEVPKLDLEKDICDIADCTGISCNSCLFGEDNWEIFYEQNKRE